MARFFEALLICLLVVGGFIAQRTYQHFYPNEE